MTRIAQLATGSSPVEFEGAMEHLAAELRRLDLLIARRIHVFRCSINEIEARAPSAPTYISDQEVDWLLQRPHDYTVRDDTVELLDAEISAQEELIAHGTLAGEENGVAFPLLRLAQLFDLSWLEYQIVLLCLAPELRRKYDRIYAYLQDDITRKRPSLDLALDLFIDTEQERWQARTQLAGHNHLFMHKLVHQTDDVHSPSGSSGLSSLLKLDQHILQYILGDNRHDEQLQPYMQVVSATENSADVDAVQVDNLYSMALNAENPGKGLLFHLHGAGVDVRRNLVIAVVQRLDCDLILVDGRTVAASSAADDQLLNRIARESVLQGIPLILERVDEWLHGDAVSQYRLSQLTAALNRYCPLAFSSSGNPWPVASNDALTVINVPVSLPGSAQYAKLWQRALVDLRFTAADTEVEQLTGRLPQTMR